MQLFSFLFFLPFYRKFWHGNVSWYGRRYKRFCTFVLAWYIHTCLIYTWLYVENEDGKYVLWYNFIVCPCHVFLVFFTWNCIMLGMKQTKIKFEVTIKLNHIIQCYTWRFTCAGERWISLKDFGTTVWFQLKLEIK